MTHSRKQKLLILIGVVLLLIALLAISLPTLEMRPGEIFLLQSSNQISAADQTPIGINWFFIFIQFIIVILIILMPIHIVVSLFTKEGRKRLLTDVLRMALIFMMMMWLVKKGPALPRSGKSNLGPQGFLEFPDFPGDLKTPPSFEANPQSWMLALIIVGIAIVVALITFFVFRFFFNRELPKKPQFQDLADNAQAAIEAIEEAQLDFDDVIIRCYAEMSQTLRIENDIQRDQAMTTHEFEQELLDRGFPTQPVQQLTRLFEQVRYGQQKTRESEKRVATQSLNEIIDFCRGQA